MTTSPMWQQTRRATLGGCSSACASWATATGACLHTTCCGRTARAPQVCVMSAVQRVLLACSHALAPCCSCAACCLFISCWRALSSLLQGSAALLLSIPSPAPCPALLAVELHWLQATWWHACACFPWPRKPGAWTLGSDIPRRVIPAMVQTAAEMHGACRQPGGAAVHDPHGPGSQGPGRWAPPGAEAALPGGPRLGRPGGAHR